MPDAGRRQILRAGMWSVPVVAVSVAAPLATASAAAPLIGEFEVPATTRLRSDSGGAGEIRVDYFDVLSVRNGSATVTAPGFVVDLKYDESLVVLTPDGAGVGVGGNQGSLVLTLPNIAAGAKLDILLRPSWIRSGFDGIGSGQTVRTWTALITGTAQPESSTTATAQITITAGPPV